MLKRIDNFLNTITMYRLTMLSLAVLLFAAMGLCFLHLLPFSALDLFISFTYLTVVCLAINAGFAYLYGAPSNQESVYITAFILALIITPGHTPAKIFFLTAAAFFAMASKYVLAINKKHIFNPAAAAIALTALLFGQYASWWIGTLYMFPLVLIIGSLITRKIKRWDLVLGFVATAAALIVGHAFWDKQNVAFIAKAMLVDSPILFFAFIMLTEPATTPPTKSLRIGYGMITGILYAPFVNIFGFYFSPELALSAGNLFSYLVSPKEKLILTLKEKVKIANDTYDFIFTPNTKLRFKPGQYLEWTLAHKKQDKRGIRRYFTIASSPTERDIRVGVKFYPKPSSYKTALAALTAQTTMVAAQLAGDFTLPSNPAEKLIFIAGGIGVTPFRSMIKYLIDTNQKRDIILLYANTSYGDIAYQEVFAEAEKSLGIKTIYTLADPAGAPAGFSFLPGRISAQTISQLVPDVASRTFYISGPHSMITSFETSLKEMGIPGRQIKTDFFPGFA